MSGGAAPPAAHPHEPMLLSDDTRDLRPASLTDMDAEIGRLDRAAKALARDGDAAAARRLLLEAGALEAAVIDALNPEADGLGPTEGAWRAATLEAGRMLLAARQGRDLDLRHGAKRFGKLLGLAARAPRPDTLEVLESGTTASPEAYFDAADQFLASSVALPIMILGLRGPGAALSAALSAGLEAGGRRVESLTVRAHGSAETHAVAFEPRTSRRVALHAAAGGWFLIAGEGPRRSGASFHAAAEAVKALGAGDEQIVLFASQVCDPARFSAEVRQGWNLRRKIWATAVPRLPGLYAAA